MTHQQSEAVEPFRNIICGILTICLSLAIVSCGARDASQDLSSAKSFLQKNDNNAAIIELKNALQKNPDIAEARYLLAKALLASGDAPSSVIELQRAADRNYPQVLVDPLMARALLAQRQEAKVIERYAKTTLADTLANADLQTSVATAYFFQGSASEAAPRLQSILAASPSYTPAVKLQARMLGNDRKFDEAIVLTQGLVKSDPRDIDAWLLHADLLAYGKGDIQAATDAYKSALSIQNDSFQARSGLITLLIAKRDLGAATTELDILKKNQPRHPLTQYLDAQVAFYKEDYKRANELIQQVIRVSPDNAKALQLAGSIQFSLHSLLEAERSLSRSLQLAPSTPTTRRLLAQTYIRLGQPAKALAALEPLLSRAQGDAEAASIAAEVYLQSGDIAQAENNFAKAVDLNPADLKSRVALVLTRLRKNGDASVINELTEIAKKEKNTYAEMALISVHLRNSNYPAALNVVDIVEAKQPGKPSTANLRGRIYLMQKDNAAARRSFEKALSIDPVFVPAASNLALLDLAEKKPDAAKKRFESVLAADPKNVDALLAIAGMRVREGAPKDEVAGLLSNAVKLNAENASPRLVLINYYLSTQNAKAAVAAAQDAAAALPNDPQILDALGRAQLAVGDINQAITSFGKLTSLAPELSDPHMRLAEAYLAAGNSTLAAQSAKRALAIAPNLVVAQKMLIELELSAKRPDEALSIAKNVQKQRPNEGVGFLLEGMVEVARGNVPAALKIYRTTVQKFPSTDSAIKFHSALIASQADVEADKFASTWLSSHRKDARFRFYLGEISIGKRNYIDAESQFREVLDLDPQNAGALNNIAWVMVKLKKPAAIEYAQKAVAISPTPALLDTLATALAANGKIDDAIETQKKAMTLAPENTGLRLGLAKIYLQGGDKTKARSELELLSKADGGDGVKAQAEQLLRGL